MHVFYPIFHCGLYCREVFNPDPERLIFHDSFFATKNRIDTAPSLLTVQEQIVKKAVVYTASRLLVDHRDSLTLVPKITLGNNTWQHSNIDEAFLHGLATVFS